jgi:hypothetical protein
VKLPDQILDECAATFRQRNTVYGAVYLRHGEVMKLLMAGQKSADMWSADDWIRMGILNMIVSKVFRYSQNFTNEGHKDSAHDLAVYAAMLESVTP